MKRWKKWGRLLKKRMPRRLPEGSLPGKESVRMRRSFPREALRYGKNGETEESLQKQLEESMRREWETLEDWQIRPSVGLEQELEQITSVYQALLEKISGGLSGREQAAGLQRLNSLLLELMGKEGGGKISRAFIISFPLWRKRGG